MTSLEIVDAIQSILQKDGSLGEMKAKLRSKVIKILSQEAADIIPNAASEFAREENGQVSLSLVFDLLESLNMKNTLKVFEAESGIQEGAKLSRDNLRKELSLSPNAGDDGQVSPILASLISRGVTASTAYADSPQSSTHSIEKKVSSGGKRQPRSSTNSPTNKSPESVDTNRRSLSPHTLLPVDGGKGLGARRAISLQISPKAEIPPVSTGQSSNPKSPTALSPMQVSPSAAVAADSNQKNDPLGRMPSVENRSRMGRDLTPLMPISPSSSSPTAADALGQKSVFRISSDSNSQDGGEASLKSSTPSSPAAPEADKLEARLPSPKASDASSRSNSPTTLGVEAGTIRDQKVLLASKPLNPVSTNVVNVRSNSKRASRGDATALRLSGGATTRSSRGWNSDDRNSDADFEFQENDKAAMKNLSPENPAVGGSRRLSPLGNRPNRSPSGVASPDDGNIRGIASDSALENLEDEEDVAEISMRSNQQDDDAYEEDYEDEFEEEDLTPKQESPSPRKGGLFTKKTAIKESTETEVNAARVESGDEFEDAFDDSFDGDQSPQTKEQSASAAKRASWGTKGVKVKDSNVTKNVVVPKQDEEVILQDLDESVDSEEIEDFEMSVADNSDSFSFLNESTNSQRSKGVSHVSRALNTSQASEGSNVMDFSVTEQELSGSGTGLSDFDHAVKALPPLRNQKK